ncbi:MAG: hypothetical protein PUA72_14015 [Lachnospiraceae bacterium]|nr:hypothetical protein [Lachnospiraceae bacterium]
MSANESESVAKGNEDMYENISKMVIDRSLQFGWNSKDTQKYLYLVMNTVVWFFLAGVLGVLAQLLIGSLTTFDVVALALFGALLPGFYGGILYLYHTAEDEE